MVTRATAAIRNSSASTVSLTVGSSKAYWNGKRRGTAFFRASTRPIPVGHPGPIKLTVPKRLGQLRNHAAQIFGELGPQARMLETVFHGRLQVAEFAAAIVALALKFEGINGFALHETRDAVGELDLAAGAFADFRKILEDRAREQVSADHRQG